MDPAGYDYYPIFYPDMHAINPPYFVVAEASSIVGIWWNADQNIVTTGTDDAKFEIVFTHEGLVTSTGVNLFLPEDSPAFIGVFTPLQDGNRIAIPVGSRVILSSDGSQIASTDASICWVTQPF